MKLTRIPKVLPQTDQTVSSDGKCSWTPWAENCDYCDKKILCSCRLKKHIIKVQCIQMLMKKTSLYTICYIVQPEFWWMKYVYLLVTALICSVLTST